MNCEDGIVTGTVTSVDTLYAHFEVENSTTVYMSLRVAHNETQKLPLLGSKVLVRKGHKFGASYVVCRSSFLQGVFTTNCSPNNAFLHLISAHKLGASDVFKLHEIIREVENNFTTLDTEIKIDVLLALLQNVFVQITQGDITFKETSCLNTLMSDFSLTTVRSCKNVEIKSQKFLDFPYWSFGVHPSKQNSMLFGYLEINPKYGFYMIKDSHYEVVCIIIDNTKIDNIFEFHNSYVLIEKFTVITEIYNKRKIPNIEYILVDISDINVVYSIKKDSVLKIASQELGYPNFMSFTLLKKSTVSLGVDMLPGVVLQVFIRFKNAKLHWNETYFVLPSNYVWLNMDFKEGSSYILHHKTELKEITNPKLTSIKKLKTFEIPDDCYFETLNTISYNTPEPLTILECKPYIESTSKLVSFRGIIRSKRFSDPLPSKTAKKPPLYGFGTPGEKVHQVVFSHSDDNHTIFLDCYLTNWDHMLMPFGLVPQMEVVVKNVSPQSRKYLKSTIFTTFEIVSYNPPISFSTVNLYENYEVDWGIPVYLSDGHMIPRDVLVWGEVFGIFIFDLKIMSQYARSRDSQGSSSLSCGNAEAKDGIKFTAKFNVSDHCGQSLVITQSLEVLRTILNLNSVNFEELVEVFHQIGGYHYNYFNTGNYAGNPMSDYLTNYLEKFKHRKVFLDLKCRKVKTSSPRAQEKPLWNCVEARRRC